jgi:tRNA A-37 threonylcarbamoyl transferase component Bud32
VLEKVEGELLIDLAERLKDDATKREKIAELVLADVLKQLAELRQLNIYHNDVRSWNIIVGKSGALLIDYGNSSGIPVEDDVVALLWALSGFLTNSRDAGGEEKDLPPQNVFKSYQSLAKAYALIKNGQHEPGRLIEQLNL